MTNPEVMKKAVQNTLIVQAVLLASVLCGCQRESDTLSVDEAISFVPRVLPLSDDAVEGTKGSLKESATLATSDIFHISAWTDAAAPETAPAHTIPSGSKVIYRTSLYKDPYWITVDAEGHDVEYLVKKDRRMVFYAYSNLPSADGAASVSDTYDGQVLSYDVSKAAASDMQTDILMACQEHTASSGTVPLQFCHPLVAVSFKKGTISAGCSIAAIAIEGVYKSASAMITPESAAQTAVADKFLWSDMTGETTVSLSGVTVDATTHQIGSYLLLIPQDFTSNVSARIRVTLADGLDIYYPLKEKWESGHIVTYTISFEK